MPILIYDPAVARKVYRTQVMTCGVQRVLKILIPESPGRVASGKPLGKCEKCVCRCALQSHSHPGSFSTPTDLNVSDQTQPQLCLEAAISWFLPQNHMFLVGEGHVP